MNLKEFLAEVGLRMDAEINAEVLRRIGDLKQMRDMLVALGATAKALASTAEQQASALRDLCTCIENQKALLAELPDEAEADEDAPGASGPAAPAEDDAPVEVEVTVTRKPEAAAVSTKAQKAEQAGKEDGPEWRAAALAAARSEKVAKLVRQLAEDGDLTVQGVIYAFHPPIKETYAQNLLSDVKRALGAAGWTLARDNTGAYRPRIAE
ncbi:hypothetical protein [Hyphomonas sp.]|uniref:hypothetical protein n=1 Tax=Hyphomonas sp. TaxID=87 RepID=UPI0025B7CC34|nr:hypothetical protein [Hyphomonas sp.]MBI1401437.1 hypothetical protein [Hyphomonas sp.]